MKSAGRFWYFRAEAPGRSQRIIFFCAEAFARSLHVILRFAAASPRSGGTGSPFLYSARIRIGNRARVLRSRIDRPDTGAHLFD